MRYSGPIPPADQLAGFEAIEPGLANRIVHMAESEVSHRHEMERHQAETARIGARFMARWMTTGQWLGASMGLLMLGLAAYAVSQQQPWVAGTAISAIAGIVGIFIWQGRSESLPPENSK